MKTFLEVFRKIDNTNLLFSVLILHIHLKYIDDWDAEKPFKCFYMLDSKHC